MHELVLNLHHDKNAKGVYVGRGSAFGNPYKIPRDGDRATVVAKFEGWFAHQVEMQRIVRRDLRSQRVLCFCAPHACHGETLVRFANSNSSIAPEPAFVFGSNLAGRHGAGAAAHAAKWYGAVRGMGEGLCGGSYAIPTKDGSLKPLAVSHISERVERFLEFARKENNREFQVTRIGCGLAGHSDDQIGPLFARAPDNCLLPATWERYRGRDPGVRLAVAGSRTIKDDARVFEVLDALTAKLRGPITVVSGGSRGVDQLGEDWAIARGHEMRRIPADWNRFGTPSAGPIRNSYMSWFSTHLVAFWDGVSPGTRNMIATATADGLAVRRRIMG